MEKLNETTEKNIIENLSSKDLKKLIKNIKKLDTIDSIDADKFKKLDRNKSGESDKKLSTTEKQLFDYIKKITEIKKILLLLEGLAKKVDEDEIFEDDDEDDTFIHLNNNFKIDKKINKTDLEKKIISLIKNSNFNNATKIINKVYENLDSLENIGNKYIYKSDNGKIINNFREEIFNIYLKNIPAEKAEKIIQNNGDYLNKNYMCPKNETMLSIRRDIMKTKIVQFNINAKKIYGEKLGGELMGFLDQKIESSKEKLCSIKIIKYIKEFENRKDVSDYLKENNREKGISENEVKILMNGILKIKKIKAKVEKTKKFIELKVNQVVYENSNKKQKEEILRKSGIKNEKIESTIEELTLINYKINKIEDSNKFINSLNKEEFSKIINNPKLYGTDEEIKEIRKEIETDRINKLNNNYFSEDNKIITIEKIQSVPTEVTESNSITVNGVIINGITRDEYKTFGIKQENGKITNIENTEALKNLVNMREKLSYLKLDFAWENRDELFGIMRLSPGFKNKDFDKTDNDLIDKYEFNDYIKFILKVSGIEPYNIDIENFSKIKKENEIGDVKGNIDYHSGMSNIGVKFIKAGYFNQYGGKNILGRSKLLNFCKNGFKHKESQEK